MTPRRETWYLADLHIGHRLLASRRGFDSVETHDKELAARWDRVVSPDDNVWVLGDISAGGRSGERGALEWLANRPGSKHLIAGNHDSVHPMHENAHRYLPMFLEVFVSVQQSAQRRIAGQTVLLSHLPYLESTDPDDMVSRYDQWRLPSRGAWLLHGHIHSQKKVSDRSIHVGLDAWNLAPVSINTIARIISDE